MRLPDELLLAVFDHVARDKDEDKDGMLAFLGRPRMPPPGYLVISKRLNRILTPRWYRKIRLPYAEGDDRVYSLLLSRPSITPLIHELDVSFPLERVHTCLWTLSQFVALRKLAVTIFDSRNEHTYDSDDESLSLTKVGESLAALFKKLPHLVDFAIDVETDSGVQMPGLDLGPCLLDGQIRQLEVAGSVFELPHLRNVKVQHLSLRLYGEGFYGEVSRPMLPLSELETLSFTGFVGVDLQANLHPFFDQYVSRLFILAPTKWLFPKNCH